jgi:hypothetical protein
LIELLHHIGRELGIVAFTERSLSCLLEGHTWPGNVREVRFLLNLIAANAGGAPVDAEHIPFADGKARAKPQGMVWKVDDRFVERVARRFPPKYDDVRAIRDHLAYRTFFPPVTPPVPDNVFRQGILTSLSGVRRVLERLTSVVPGAGEQLPSVVTGPSKDDPATMSTPTRAATVGRRLWYERRARLGRTVAEMAAEARVSEVQVRNDLVRFGLRKRRKRNSS